MSHARARAAARDSERFRRLLDRHPAEEPALDEPGVAWVQRRQIVQGDIEVEDPVGLDRGKIGCFRNGHVRRASSSLDAPSPSRVAHEDVSHGLRGDREEVGARLPLDTIHADELEEGLVDESGRIERVAAALEPELPAGDSLELVVNDRDELIQGLAVPFAQREEKLRDVPLTRHAPPSAGLGSRLPAGDGSSASGNAAAGSTRARPIPQRATHCTAAVSRPTSARNETVSRFHPFRLFL
jgi:hypothetical protein